VSRDWVVCIDGTWNHPGQTDADPVDAKEVITQSNVLNTWEGSTGTGASERVMEGWAFLAERVQEGDRIHLFGFSRGAYAVGSLGGFLDFAGLPAKPSAVPQGELLDLFAAYREQRPAPNPGSRRPVRIDFIGVFDTVGALAFGHTFNAFHRIHPGNADRVVHALALDELRDAFTPSYWDPPPPAPRPT
jgi:uncharacterized protein (DUF2235 family)